MLAQFGNVPGVEVICNPQTSSRVETPFHGLRLKGGSSTHRGGGGELPNEVVLNEENDGLFAQVAGREGPYGRSLPLDLDEDIFEELLGYSGDFVGLRLVAASCGLSPPCRLLLL